MTDKKEKTYRTLTDLLNMPAGEAEPLIMRAAPAIERVADAVGLFDTFFDQDFVTYQDKRAFLKLNKAERERVEAKVLGMGKELMRNLMAKGLGECLPDVMEVLAAVQGITVVELKAAYTTLEVINMAKAVLSDQGFLSFAATYAGDKTGAAAGGLALC